MVTLGVLLALLAIALLVYVRTRHRRVLIVTAETLVLRDYPTGPNASGAPNPVVAVVTPGQTYPVLDIRYDRDVQAVKILLAGTSTGWVITGPTANVARSR